jgi:hypothetical protein
LPDALQNQEREIIETALAGSKGKVAGPKGAAAKLGIPRSTLDSKIQAAEDQETQVYLRLVVIPCFQFPKIRHGEQVAELKKLFNRDYRNIILDLWDLRLADRDAVRFLRGREADGVKLENCPAYVREWMDREQD